MAAGHLVTQAMTDITDLEPALRAWIDEQVRDRFARAGIECSPAAFALFLDAVHAQVGEGIVGAQQILRSLSALRLDAMPAFYVMKFGRRPLTYNRALRLLADMHDQWIDRRVPDGGVGAADGTPRELVLLVDERDRPVGSAEKHEAHYQGLRHRAISVFGYSADGRVLLQRRSASKYHSAGCWANLCCGHPRPGESVLDAAQRRLREEMGLSADLRPLCTVPYDVSVGGGMRENEIVHVFTGLIDVEPDPDPREVADWAWIDPADLIRRLRSEPDTFAPWFRHYAEVIPDRVSAPWNGGAD